MKTCSSCGAELADDARECICGWSVDEGGSPTSPALSEFESPAFDSPPGGPADGMKPCVFCGSEIVARAMRCPRCAGFLPIAEGTIFSQYFFFLFSCLAIAIGCLLPWERDYALMNLTGADSIAGGFMLLFATYGVIASVWNIYHRKMIVWPVMLAALDGAVFGIIRVVQILKDVKSPAAGDDFGAMVQNFRAHAQAIGPGLYLVVIFSVIVMLSIVVSVFQGAKQDAKRKEAEREARAARKTRR